jgi:hypothetical protein
MLQTSAFHAASGTDEVTDDIHEFYDLGGESQVMMDIFDRTGTIRSVDSGIPNVTENHFSRPTGTKHFRRKKEVSKTSKETEGETFNASEIETVQPIVPVKAKDNKRVVIVNDKISTTLPKTNEFEALGNPNVNQQTSPPRPVHSHNVSLVGQTTKGIKNGATKTFFSLADLHLPTGAKRQKP